MDTTIAVSFLFWLGVWAALSRSPFILTAMELLVTKAPMTREDVDSYLINTGKFKLLQLWHCPWCQAFWTSLAFAVSIHCAAPCADCPWEFLFRVLVATFAAYPVFLLPIFYLWKK